MNSHIASAPDLHRAVQLPDRAYRGLESHASGSTAPHAQRAGVPALAPTVSNCTVLQGFSRVANLLGNWG